jgi:hypothetical protein
MLESMGFSCLKTPAQRSVIAASSSGFQRKSSC